MNPSSSFFRRFFRTRPLLGLAALGFFVSSPGEGYAAGDLGPSPSDPFTDVAHTNDSTLNDLVRRLPIFSRRQEEQLAGLSAIQEQMILHERLMLGEGLPERHRALFACNYNAIVTAIVDDRITMEYGRELLCVHRQLLDKAYGWQHRPQPDKLYGDVIIMALEEIQEELGINAEPLSLVPYCVRTPAIKGHQLWVEELLQWGAGCEVLSRGDLSRIRLLAARLERFEGYYKRDGHLTYKERENLHERLVELNRALVDSLSR